MGVFKKLFGKGAANSSELKREQIDEFIRNALREPVLCRLRVENVGQLLSALQLHFVIHGMSTADALEHIDQNLVGVCPACRTHSAGKGLVLITAYQGMTSMGISFGGASGGAERLLAGKCRNRNCSCNAMLISWRPKGTPDTLHKPYLDFYA